MASATATAPIRETRINQTLFTGESGIRTIQAAVNYARADGGLFVVVIPWGYAGVEPITGIVNGTANIFIRDDREAQMQLYRWSGSGSAFTPVSVAQLGGFIAHGDPPKYPGSTNIGFVGNSGIITVVANAGDPMPSIALNGWPGDGTAIHTFFLAELDPATGNPRVQMPQPLLIGNLQIAPNTEEAVPGPSIRIDNQGDVIVNPATGQSLNLNWEGGGAATIFGDGAGHEVAALDAIGNLDINGNFTVHGKTTLGADPTQPQEAATKHYVDEAIAESGNFVYPGAGVTVSTGAAWGASIDPATLARTNVDNNFTASQSIGGNLLCDQLMSRTNGWLLLNRDSGTNVVFGDGKGGPAVGGVDTAGNASFAGTVIAKNSITAGGGGFLVAGGGPQLIWDGGSTYLDGAPNGRLLINQTHGAGSLCMITGVVGIRDASTNTNCNIQTSGPDLRISPASAGIYFNMDSGTDGVWFGDGAGHSVGHITAAGVGRFNGGLQVGSSGQLAAVDGTGNAFFVGTVDAAGIASDSIQAKTPTGWLSLNKWSGTQVAFGNGAGGFVASIDSNGTANFNGPVNSGSGFVVSSGGPKLVWDGGSSFLEGAPNGRLLINQQSGPLSTCQVTGSFSATSKNFMITHPLDDTKLLVHGCLEGPESGVYYRGETETVDGSVEVTLPDYFEALTAADYGRTVHLTQIFEDGEEEFVMLAASRVVGGKFRIRSSAPDARVYWEVKAVRKDIGPLAVVTDNPDYKDSPMHAGVEPSTKPRSRGAR